MLNYYINEMCLVIKKYVKCLNCIDIKQIKSILEKILICEINWK